MSENDVDAHADTPVPSKPRGWYGKGYVPDHEVGHDKSKDLSIRHLLGASTGEPPEASLEALVTHVWDQRGTSSCTGHAFGRAYELRMKRLAAEAGIALDVQKPSVTAVYQAGVAADRPTPNTKLKDEGAAPSQVMRGMHEQGIPDDQAWPPGGFDAACDADPAYGFITEEPDLAELEAASKAELRGFYRIGEGADQTVVDVAQALAAGYPVAVGVMVDQDFEDQDGAGVCGPCGPSPLGGHMLCVVGYRTNARGAREFRVINSWGPGWADRGFFWANAEWLKTASDLYAITVAPK